MSKEALLVVTESVLACGPTVESRRENAELIIVRYPADCPRRQQNNLPTPTSYSYYSYSYSYSDFSSFLLQHSNTIDDNAFFFPTRFIPSCYTPSLPLNKSSQAKLSRAGHTVATKNWNSSDNVQDHSLLKELSYCLPLWQRRQYGFLNRQRGPQDQWHTNKWRCTPRQRAFAVDEAELLRRQIQPTSPLHRWQPSGNSCSRIRQGLCLQPRWAHRHH